MLLARLLRLPTSTVLFYATAAARVDGVWPCDCFGNLVMRSLVSLSNDAAYDGLTQRRLRSALHQLWGSVEPSAPRAIRRRKQDVGPPLPRRVGVVPAGRTRPPDAPAETAAPTE